MIRTPIATPASDPHRGPPIRPAQGPSDVRPITDFTPSSPAESSRHPQRFAFRKIGLKTAWLVAFWLTISTPETPAAAAPFSPARPDRILVKPHPSAPKATLRRLHAAQGSRVLREFTAIDGIQVLQLPPGRDAAMALRRYRDSGLVEFAEPDHRLELAATPNDPAYAAGSLWHLHNTGQAGGKADADIDAPEAWDTLTDATPVIVATIDSGVRATHEDLAANLWVNPGEIAGNGIDDDSNGYIDDIHGINATANDGRPIDVVGHGTQVAGYIGAVGNNGVGSAGVSWRVRVMACRITDDAGSVFVSDAAQGMDYARAHGARIINCSFVAGVYSSTLYSAINSCRSAGIIIVAAAGNNSNDNDLMPYYPASYNLDNIISVAATTRSDGLASFSNFGAASVDLAAPGQDVYSTYNTADNAYLVNSGTSFASPIVAGALALIRARNPSATYRQCIDQVLATTDPLSALSGRCVTGGRLNLARALGPAVAARFTASPAAGPAPLTVRYTNTSLGLPRSFTWDFGDGSNPSTNENPVHLYQNPGSYVTRLTVTGNGGATSTTQSVITAVSGYQVTNTSYAWIDPSSLPALSLSGDAISSALPVPFPFRFFGETQAVLYVGANGILGFQTPSLTSPANTDLPNAAAPNSLICPFWDDLNPGTASIRFGTVGTAPNRRAVAAWTAVSSASGGPQAAFTFEAILEEGTSDIVFQYLEVDAGSRNASAGGRSATVGLEHRTGLFAHRYSFNGSSPLANGQAIRFVAGPGGSTITNPPPPIPVALILPSWNNGLFTASFTGDVGRVYAAQFSTNLGSPGSNAWQTFQVLTGAGGLLQISNEAPADTPRFYRIESR